MLTATFPTSRFLRRVECFSNPTPPLSRSFDVLQPLVRCSRSVAHAEETVQAEGWQQDAKHGRWKKVARAVGWAAYLLAKRV